MFARRAFVVSLCATLAAPLLAQSPAAPPPAAMFKDVEARSWTYAAMETLRARDVIVGYPAGYFDGKRTLTRFEFAVALDRTLRQIDPSSAGASVPSMSRQDGTTFRKLVEEFRGELANLGESASQLSARLKGLDVHAATPRPDTGATAAPVRSLPSASQVSLRLWDTDPSTMPAGAWAYGLAIQAGHAAGGGSHSLTLSGVNEMLRSGAPGALAPNQSFGISGFGAGGPQVSVGHIPVDMGHLVLSRPPTSTPGAVFRADGAYYADGARMRANLGAVSVEAMGAKTDGAAGRGGGGNLVEIGTTPTANGFRLVPQQAQPAMAVNSMAGLNVGVGTPGDGHLRLSALGLAGSPQPAAAPAGYNAMLILGADGDIRLANRIDVSADFSRSIPSVQGSAAPDSRDAFNASVGYGSGGLSVNAGYRYVDPLFAAPGYWGRIGSWINPTNIQGPTFRAEYDFSRSFGVNLGGDFFSAARDQSAVGGLSLDDNINRYLVGLRWNIGHNIRATLDYEGVFWTLSGAHSAVPGLAAGGIAHPAEHYLTLGTGISLSNSALFQLNYQFGMVDGAASFGGSSIGQTNVNTLTGQVSIKF